MDKGGQYIKKAVLEKKNGKSGFQFAGQSVVRPLF